MLKRLLTVLLVTCAIVLLKTTVSSAQETDPVVDVPPITQIVTSRIPITVTVTISDTQVAVPLFINFSTSVFVESPYEISVLVDDFSVEENAVARQGASALPTEVSGNTVHVPGIDIDYGMWRTSPDADDCDVILYDRSGERIVADVFGRGKGKVYQIDEDVYQVELRGCAQFSLVERLTVVSDDQSTINDSQTDTATSGDVPQLPRVVQGEGAYVVGFDIEYGLWRTDRTESECTVTLYDKDLELSEFDYPAAGKVYRLDESVYQIEMQDCGELSLFETLDGERPSTSEPQSSSSTPSAPTGFDFREFSRNIESYVNTEVTFTGRISQITERTDSSLSGVVGRITGAEKAAGVLMVDNDSDQQIVFRISEELYQSRILEDDEIIMTGIVQEPEVFSRGLTDQEVLLAIIKVTEYSVQQ